jgi:hypothetical protein
MDRTAIVAALNELYDDFPYLPRRDDLAQIVFDAYHDPCLPPDSPWRLPAVVAALWPIGAAAGAQRGHTVMLAAIRGEVTQALEDPTLTTDARWVVMNFVRAAEDLPTGPDPTRDYSVAPAEGVLDYQQRLAQAITVGLGNSWQSGHNRAAEEVLTAFADKVVELVGHDRLTAPLIPTLTGDGLLDEIAFAAHEATVADLDGPSPRAARPTPPAKRTAAARAFAPLRSLDPAHRTQPIAGYKPQTGPGRPGPGR